MEEPVICHQWFSEFNNKKISEVFTMTRFRNAIVLSLSFLLLTGSITAQVIDGVAPRDGIYDKVWIEEKRPIPLAYVREADVLWKKRVWQMIDLREKINHPLYFPNTTLDERQSLMQVLVSAINEGSIRAYQNDEFTFPFTPEEIRNTYARVETRTFVRPDPPYDEYDSTITIPLTSDEVIKFRIKEEWFFDSKRSVLDVRILGVAPVRERVDPVSRESLGDQTLFWVYFPEARNVLVNAEVFNRHNDAQRVSYDDMFLRRMFNSYIYKESNVYDRQIQDYYTNGLDQLLEAERIKNEIRNFELDIWEY
jgi:gliding motility associated protien GldN